MDRSEEQQRYLLIREMAKRYPNCRLTADQCDTYVGETAHFTMEQLRAGLTVACEHSLDFAPSVPRLVWACGLQRARARPSLGVAAAWAWVVANLPDSGRSRVVAGHEDAEAAVQLMGGWDALGQRSTSDRHWARREFGEIYVGLSEREVRVELGLAETRPELRSGSGLTKIGG